MILLLIRTFRPTLGWPKLPVPFSATEYQGTVGSARTGTRPSRTSTLREWIAIAWSLLMKGVVIPLKVACTLQSVLCILAYVITIPPPPGPGKWVLLLFSFPDGEKKAEEKRGNPNKATQELKSRAGA